MASAPEPAHDENADTDHAGLDAESLAAIRSLMAEQAPPPKEVRKSRVLPVRAPKRRPKKSDAFPALEAPEQDEGVQMPEAMAKPRKRLLSLPLGFARPKSAAPKHPPAAPARSPARQGGASRAHIGTAMIARIKAYRPTPKHIAIALLLLLVLFRPWLIVGVAFVLAFVLTAVLLIVGFDGFWNAVAKSVNWYARRRPSRAAVVRQRFDTFAVKWDAILDRFPEGRVDGLYMPDFAEIAKAEARHDEAVKRRLAGLNKESV